MENYKKESLEEYKSKILKDVQDIFTEDQMQLLYTIGFDLLYRAELDSKAIIRMFNVNFSPPMYLEGPEVYGDPDAPEPEDVD